MSLSAVVRLFDDNGNPSPYYSGELIDLVRHFENEVRGTEVIDFGNENRFKVTGLLGHGGSQYIFDIGEGKAIRVWKVPLIESELEDLFLEGHDDLAFLDGVIVKVFPEKSISGQFTVVEKVDVHFTLEEYLKISPRPRSFRSMMGHLVEFSQSFHMFSKIRDFKAANIIWKGSSWMLIDWDGDAVFSHQITSPTLFENENLFRNLPESIRLEIKESTFELRRKRKLGKGCSLVRSLSELL